MHMHVHMITRIAIIGIFLLPKLAAHGACHKIVYVRTHTRQELAHWSVPLGNSVHTGHAGPSNLLE